MRAYLENLPPRAWAMAVIPAILVGYPLVKIVVPFLFHFLVPDVVRSVLSVI